MGGGFTCFDIRWKYFILYQLPSDDTTFIYCTGRGELIAVIFIHDVCTLLKYYLVQQSMYPGGMKENEHLSLQQLQ